MKTTESRLKRMAVTAGACMMIAWILGTGVVGFALWLALSYALTVSNVALGVVCVLLLFSPIVFGLVWAPLAGLALMQERYSEGAEISSVPGPLAEQEDSVRAE